MFKTELIKIHRNVLVGVDNFVYKDYYSLFIIFWESQSIKIHISILKKCFGLGIYTGSLKTYVKSFVLYLNINQSG